MLKKIGDMYGGMCLLNMTNEGMDNPDYFTTYFYYEVMEEAIYSIRKLNGQPLGGSKGLELKYIGHTNVMAVQKHLRKGVYEENLKKRKDHYRPSARNSNPQTSIRTIPTTNKWLMKKIKYP